MSSGACVVVALCAGLSLVSCIPHCDPNDREDRTQGPEPGVVCAGASLKEASQKMHPRMLRGTLRAPRDAYATRSKRGWRSWIQPAHAFALEHEEPVFGARLGLYTVTPLGGHASTPIVETTTDAQGKWCVRLPDDVLLTPALMYVARKNSWSTRQLVMHRFDAEIATQGEALIRLLHARKIDLTKITAAQFLNLRTLADTSFALLSGVDQTQAFDHSSLLERYAQVYAQDERINALLQTLPTHQAQPE